MDKKKATEAAQNTNLKRNDNSASAQRARVIQALRTGPKTTIELRELWGVMSPAPRVFELRLLGYCIETLQVNGYTPDGVLHRGVARYVLVSEPTPGSCNCWVKMPAPANDACISNHEGGAA